MKKLVLAIFTALFATTAWAYKIEGRITNAPDTIIVQLFERIGRGGMAMPADTITNGRFILERTTDQSLLLTELTISVPNSERALRRTIWVTPDLIVQVQGEGSDPRDWEVVNSLQEQKISDQLMRITRADFDLLRAEKHSDPVRDSIVKGIMQKTWPIVLENPDNAAALSEIDGGFDQFSREQLQQLYDKMSPETRQTLIGEGVLTALNPVAPIQVGELYRDFEAFDRENTKHNLSEYMGNGKYVMLDFWFGACGACHSAIPGMKGYYQKYKDRLEIVAVNVDDNPKMWDMGTQMMDFPWANWSDRKGMSAGVNALYGIRMYPTYVLIDPEGKVVVIESYYTKMEKAIEELFENLTL